MKTTIFLPSGDTLVIESPNDYFLRRGWGWWRNMPIIGTGEFSNVRVELFSNYEEDDFVTLTWGANRWIKHRAKKII